MSSLEDPDTDLFGGTTNYDDAPALTVFMSELAGPVDDEPTHSLRRRRRPPPLPTSPPPVVVVHSTPPTENGNLGERIRSEVRRLEGHPDQPKTLPPTPPPPPRRTRSICTRVRDWYELLVHDTARAWAPRLERCYRARKALECVIGCVALVVVLVLVWTSYRSDPTAFVDDVARASYARHGHHGVDLTRVSAELSCAELSSGAVRRPHAAEEPSLGRVRDTAEALMHADALACLCAPMVASWRRYVAVRTADDTIVHAYNPAIDRDWDGSIDASTRIDVGVAEVDENQRQLFPERHRGDVTLERRTAVRLTYRDVECAAAAIVVQRHRAYCVQACIDLLDGRSVYDVAAQTTAP